MTRLYDRVMAYDKVPERVRRTYSACEVVEVDNIADYYFEHIKDYDVGRFEGFVNIAPPWPDFFIEFRAPLATVHDCLHDDLCLKVESFYAAGLYCHAIERDARMPARLTIAEAHNMGGSSGTAQAGETELLDVRWEMTMSLLVEATKGGTIMPAWGWSMWITSSGEAYRREKDTIFASTPNPLLEAAWIAPIQSSADRREGRELFGFHMVRHFLKPALLALTFANCKNVVMRVERPPDWQQKAAVKKHKRPLVTYHVLDIEPMKQVLRTEGGSDKVGITRALHICRGHFATYDEKPLFGRIKGTFWREAHVRGSRDDGIALKDYNVKTPNPAQS